MTAAQIVLAALTLGALVYTVVAYPHRYGALSGRSRLYRTVGVCLLDLLLLLASMFQSIDFRAGVSPRVAPIREALYFSSCLFILLSLICISLLDALESYSTIRRERKGELERMLRGEIDKAREEHAASERRKAENEREDDHGG